MPRPCSAASSASSSTSCTPSWCRSGRSPGARSGETAAPGTWGSDGRPLGNRARARRTRGLSARPGPTRRQHSSWRRKALPPMSPCSIRGSACPGPGTAPRHALTEIYDLLRHVKLALIFVNTRFQAEAAVLGPFGAQRRQPADRAAPRVARCRAAPQGGGRHGGRPAQSRGGDRDPRPRDRLGRRRPRDQRGGAERGQPPDPADRPRQPPSRRAVARHPGPANRFEVLECRAAITAAAAGARTPPCRAPAPSTCWPSTSSAWPAPSLSRPMRSSTRSRMRPRSRP